MQMKGIIAAKIANLKVIWHINDSETIQIIKLIFNLVASLSDGFILTGERVKKFYFNNRTIKPKLNIKIQAPVNCSRFNPEIVEKDEVIDNNDRIKITTVGNINPTKRMEDFIDIANQLNQEYKNLIFYIIGPQLESQTKYLKRLKNLIKKYKLKNLIFYGRADKVESVLKASDIFVCTSESESGPMCVWEAMSMEKAIVSTDVGDVFHYIEDGVNGFLVAPRDVKMLAEKIAILLEDENLRKKFGKLARLVTIKRLNIEICAKKHKEFYLKVMAQQ
jgi:glycosyltransferase involved in cell wall biosynthesis